MPGIDKSKAFKEKMARETAKKMRRIALAAKEILQERLNTKYPPASRTGQYPRKRSGIGRSTVVIDPNNEGAIRANKNRVTLKYNKTGFYMDLLVKKGRKGPGDVVKLKELQDKVAQIMKG